MRKGGREEESDKRERKEGRKGVRERGREEGRGRRGGKKETKIKKSTDTINKQQEQLWDVCSPPIYIVHCTCIHYNTYSELTDRKAIDRNLRE